MNYETLFVYPNGRTTRAEFLPALITLGAALAFYAFEVTGRTAHFCMLMLMYPAFVLLTRRVHDMGYHAWLLVVPLILALAAFAIKLRYLSLGEPLDDASTWIALAVYAAFALWGCVGPGKPAANT